MVTGIAVFLAFESNGNVSRLRAHEFNRSLGKNHLDNYIFKKTVTESVAAPSTPDFDSFKLSALTFPMKSKNGYQEFHLDLAIRFSKVHNSQKTMKHSEEILRDIAIQYFLQTSQVDIFEKISVNKVKKDLLLSFNDVLANPVEGIYISNVRVKN